MFQVMNSPNKLVYFLCFFTSWIRIQEAYLVIYMPIRIRNTALVPYRIEFKLVLRIRIRKLFLNTELSVSDPDIVYYYMKKLINTYLKGSGYFFWTRIYLFLIRTR